MENGTSAGGSGGGRGHDDSQSTHEQAGVFNCTQKITNLVLRNEIIIHEIKNK